MKTKYIILLIIAGFLTLSLNGCSLLRKRVEKTEKIEYKINGKNKTEIYVENTTGKINVSRSADTLGMITIEAVKTADVKVDELDKPIEDVTIKLDTTGDGVKIETEVRSSHRIFRKNQGGKVDYDIRVPANLKVNVHNINGAITITRVDNDINAETVNGSINVTGCPGIVNVNGVNGKVTCNIDSLTGGITVDVINGSVNIGGLRYVNANVDASTVNGKVKFKDLTFSNINSEKKSLTGTLGKGGSMIRISAVNGSINFDANRIVSKKDDDFEIKIDFDDDDPIKIIEREPNEPKHIDSMNIPVQPRNADTLKKK